MKPKCASHAWLDPEVDELVDAVAKFIMETAWKHQRTEGAIATRMARILDSAAVAKAIKRIKWEAYYP